MTSCIVLSDLAEQNFKNPSDALKKLVLAYRLCIARFAEKFNLEYRIVKFKSQQEEESWVFSMHQNMPMGSTEH